MTYTIDENKWFAPALKVSENEWVVAWINEPKPQAENKFEYKAFRMPPTNELIKKIEEVVDKTRGNGTILSIDGQNLVVDFGNRGVHSVPFYFLMYRENTDEDLNKTVSSQNLIIKRLIKISLKTKNRGELLAYKNNEQGEMFKTHDMRGDAVTLNEFLKMIADEDYMTQCLSSSSGKSALASTLETIWQQLKEKSA